MGGHVHGSATAREAGRTGRRWRDRPLCRAMWLFKWMVDLSGFRQTTQNISPSAMLLVEVWLQPSGEQERAGPMGRGLGQPLSNQTSSVFIPCQKCHWFREFSSGGKSLPLGNAGGGPGPHSSPCGRAGLCEPWRRVLAGAVERGGVSVCRPGPGFLGRAAAGRAPATLGKGLVPHRVQRWGPGSKGPSYHLQPPSAGSEGRGRGYPLTAGGARCRHCYFLGLFDGCTFNLRSRVPKSG